MTSTALTSRSITIITLTAAATVVLPLGAFWARGTLDPVAGGIGTLLVALVVVSGALLTCSVEP